MDFVSKLNRISEGFSFSHLGWTALREPLSIALYKDWLKAGHHATMEYLERHLPMKENPEKLMPKARSALVFAKSYFPHPYPSDRVLSARTALYASGLDYHTEFQRELESVRMKLEQEFLGEEFLCFTDSAPILERDLAARAGLGWVGKNSCVIHPKKGSLFFLGEIFTTLVVPEGRTVVPDMCGTCDRCLRACPTQAFTAPRVLDAGKCISYWTIEARQAAPEELRTQFGDWFFGCDICQTVCPWNEKVFGKERMQRQTHPTPSSHETLAADLRSILQSRNRDLRERFADLPYSRARSLGLKRNALYVIANLELRDLDDAVQECLNDPDLRELASWTRTRLKTFDNP
jgi:epoxyqueuosine reductase